MWYPVRQDRRCNMHHYFIINPAAGQGKAAKLVPAIRGIHGRGRTAFYHLPDKRCGGRHGLCAVYGKERTWCGFMPAAEMVPSMR